MARLLRVHFSSIGDRDARLAPLTLDFRHAAPGEESGTGADTVIWLRNAGGKSSMLNLFYSVFRPSAREFLGASAEGKARRLEQYVKGRDLAFVVTEWDVEAPAEPTLFAQAPVRTRVIGQILAWRNQQRSSDLSNLRRLFFSLVTQPGQVELDTLPILGLGKPVESFDAFRDWLRDLQHRVSTTQVVTTDHQLKWHQHLESIGLDPELFRYQLAMNRREGAADEVFRFQRDADFVRFLLELAYDPRAADQIATNLQAQRDNLRDRPVWELERRFVGEALELMRPLAADAAELGLAEDGLKDAIAHMGGTVATLELRALDLDRAADDLRTKGNDAKDRVRRAENERTKKQRWARGLERLALQYDVDTATIGLREAEELLREAKRELAAAESALPLQKLRAIDAERQTLRDALERAESEIEPLRRAACVAGSHLRVLLQQERARLDEVALQVGRLRDAARRQEREAAERQRAASARIASRARDIAHLDQRINERDRARDRLLEVGRLDARESASAGLARWNAKVQALADVRSQAADERQAATIRADQVQQRKTEVSAARTGLEARGRDLSAKLDEAYAWRDRLRTDPRILEVEGVGEASPEAPGLEARLRHRADIARRRGIESRVEGAQGERSLEWLREHGLLPSPPEVQRVVAALADQGVAAHTGPEYLEQNAPVAVRSDLLRTDPGRFSGVVVPDAAALRRAAGIELEGLHAPVTISIVAALVPGETPPDSIVVPPDPALYDAEAADERRPELERALARQTERERTLADEEEQFAEIARDVAAYVARHGGGALDALDREHRGVVQQLELANDELGKLVQEETRLRERRAELDLQIEQLDRESRDVALAAEAVRAFIETHDAGIEAVRDQRAEAARDQRAAEEESKSAEEEVLRHARTAEEHHERSVELRIQGESLGRERDNVTLFDESPPPDHLPLEAARAAYQTSRAQYEREIKADRLQARLEALQERRAEAQAEYERQSRGIEAAEIARLADRSDLAEERARLKRSEEGEVQSVANAAASLREARRRLDEATKLRRDADDLPAEIPRPGDAASARAMAEDLSAQADRHVVERDRASEEADTHVRRANEQEARAKQCHAHAEGLRSVAEGAETELPSVRPVTIASEANAEAESVKASREAFTTAKKRREAARREVRRRAEQVQRLANRTEYGSLKASYRERMKESADALAEGAAEFSAAIEARLVVIHEALTRLDDDRRLIVEQLLHVADQVASLLQRVERASRLPASVEGWAGRPYVRIKAQFPRADEERRSLLAPMVDRIVEQAEIPSGTDLVFRTAAELAGVRGFEVHILKPDAEPRPDPIPIHQMSTFSRGQQLTAAILLYCTLVQLRARTRGRARSDQDAGVLILDNPIGTCSNVALMRLQRTIASQMRVQLIYTTGVEDLEALAILPNKIRLRNTHRDRATGDHHVTADDEDDSDRGVVDGVRLVEVPAR